MDRPRVFLAMPLYGNDVNHAAAAAFYGYPTNRQSLDVQHATMGCSLLGRVFTTLWAEALNQAEKGLITHFAMLHSDVAPQQFWLDVLMEEMNAHQVDIVSVVIAIKDMHGLTSTAIADPANPWTPTRRLTMHEVHNRLPKTFDAMDCAKANLNPDRHPLLVNTGCMLCDIRKPWVLGDWTKNAPTCFTIRDRMLRDTDGKFTMQTEPEDWLFSRQAAACGARIVATTKVGVEHWGTLAWSNQNVWGQWKHDVEILGEVAPEYADLVEPETPAEGITNMPPDASTGACFTPTPTEVRAEYAPESEPVTVAGD